MKAQLYEDTVANYFRNQGYNVTQTPISNDYGIDCFAEKGKERIAVQAKMYGTGRKINRQMIMELHGSKDYFNCTKAIIATNGSVLPDAQEVANKLKIEILKIEYQEIPVSRRRSSNNVKSFNNIWEQYIIPLSGKELSRESGNNNKILKVDWSGIERITSKGKVGKIKIEIFKYAVNKILVNGYITRDEINQNYVGRASSGVILILSQVPYFLITTKPIGLKYNP